MAEEHKEDPMTTVAMDPVEQMDENPPKTHPEAQETEDSSNRDPRRAPEDVGVKENTEESEKNEEESPAEKNEEVQVAEGTVADGKPEVAEVAEIAKVEAEDAKDQGATTEEPEAEEKTVEEKLGAQEPKSDQPEAVTVTVTVSEEVPAQKGEEEKKPEEASVAEKQQEEPKESQTPAAVTAAAPEISTSPSTSSSAAEKSPEPHRDDVPSTSQRKKSESETSPLPKLMKNAELPSKDTIMEGNQEIDQKMSSSATESSLSDLTFASNPLTSLHRRSTLVAPQVPFKIQLENKPVVTIQLSAKDTSRDAIMKGLKENKVLGMWQQYNLHMILKGKDTTLEVDDHPLTLRGTLKENEVSFVIKGTNLSPLLGKPAKIKLTRQQSDDPESSREKEKEKGKPWDAKAKQPAARIVSMPPIDEHKKGGFFKSKVADKPKETTLEKFGKETRPRSSSSVFSSSSKQKITSTPKGEEIKFDKKKSKTGRLESFGVDLVEQVTREGGMVPKVVLACTVAIEKKALDRVGIYRLSAAQSKINSLQLEFMNGNEPDLVSDDSAYDVITISGLLKNYFRELPKSVFPQKQYNDFISIPRQDLTASTFPEQLALKNKQMDDMKAALAKLPKPCLHTIDHIVRHLKKIAANNEVNKMTADNLSLLFGPSMMGGKENSVFDMPLQSAVLLFLMNHYSQIFVDELDCKSSPATASGSK